MTTGRLTALLEDLAAETVDLERLLARLDPDQWDAPTPAIGWCVRDQVSHLAFFDETAVMAATRPDRFRTHAKEMLELGPTFPDIIASRYRDLAVDDLTQWFRNARDELIDVFGGLDGSERLPWYGPAMSATSSATARLMETWAHGQDVFDTFGQKREPTDRLRHIAHLGVRTLGFSFALHGREVPEVPVRVELCAPSGDQWAWGDPAAANRVSGSALDFCLLVTQRRHALDTDLLVSGPVASEWLSIAQAFAGAPGTGRAATEPDRMVSW